MVPALFEDGEKEALAAACRDEVVARGLDDSREGLWRAFMERCRTNLHVVLAMSPVGETLRTRCRCGPRGPANPAPVCCCCGCMLRLEPCLQLYEQL